MKKLFFFSGIAVGVIVSSCGSKKLNQEEVARIFQEEKVYPKVMEYRVFCGNNETAEEMHDKGLDEQGLVTVKLNHTIEDVGMPLISFTEKAKPYLVETESINKAIDMQKVKLADEYFHAVTDITTNAKGDRAEVVFTTSVRNKTPFMVLSQENKDSIQSRMTYFSMTKDGWKWDGKINKIQSKER